MYCYRLASLSLFSLTISLCSTAPVRAQSEASVSPFSAIVIRGARALPESLVRKTAENAATKASTPLAAQSAALEAVRALYRTKGYLMAQVTDAEIQNDNVLTLQIAEGVIRSVIIRGNRKTREGVIRHALSIRSGDVYQEGRVNDERKRLSRLGIFADIAIAPRVPGIDIPPVDDDDTGNKTSQISSNKSGKEGEKAEGTIVTPPVSESPSISPAPLIPTSEEIEIGAIDLVVSVKETDTASVQASIGYADGAGAVGFVDLSERNLLGTGQQAQILWQRTVQVDFRSDGSVRSRDARSAFALGYSYPSLNRNDTAFGIQVYDSNTVLLPLFGGVQETLRTYEKRRGARARIGRELTPKLNGFITARRDEIGYDNIPNSLFPPFGEWQSSFGMVGALGVNLIADGRDSSDFPNNGYRASLLYENSSHIFGGNLPFSQIEGDWRQYIALKKRPQDNGRNENPVPVLAARVMGGYSQGDVPLQEQFYLGGYELLRGYDLFAYSGRNMLLATAELRFPISSGLQVVAFTDYGGAWDPSPRRLRASVGAGLRFATPIGPIRLDAAYGTRLQTYISLGQSF
jgi:outer membrane protein assembly factor BamA